MVAGRGIGAEREGWRDGGDWVDRMDWKIAETEGEVGAFDGGGRGEVGLGMRGLAGEWAVCGEGMYEDGEMLFADKTEFSSRM